MFYAIDGVSANGIHTNHHFFVIVLNKGQVTKFTLHRRRLCQQVSDLARLIYSFIYKQNF